MAIRLRDIPVNGRAQRHRPPTLRGSRPLPAAPESTVPPAAPAPAPPQGLTWSPGQSIPLTAAPRTYLVLKRALDVLLTTCALVLLSPALLLIALLIKLEDGGPVLYSQTRLGAGGRAFRFFKFRSMQPDADALREGLKATWSRNLAGKAAIRFKLPVDPRVTRIGGFLRRFSLDELPQLLNIIRGDMSLVGPRPPIPEEVAEYGVHELRRLSVPQGLTCIWQVRGRSLIPFPEQVELDLEYSRRRCLVFDLWLLACTVPAVLTGKGAC